MRDIEIKGNTVDEKLKHLMLILTRLARRSRKAISIVMPTSPLVFYIPDIGPQGELVSFLSPVKGEVVRILFKVQQKDFKQYERCEFRVDFLNMKGASSQTFLISSGVNIISCSKPLNVGDEVAFSVSLDIKPKDILEPIPSLLSINILPAREESTTQTLAIEALEEAADEILSD